MFGLKWWKWVHRLVAEASPDPVWYQDAEEHGLKEDLSQVTFVGGRLSCGNRKERTLCCEQPSQLLVSLERERSSGIPSPTLCVHVYHPARKRKNTTIPLNMALALLPSESSSNNWSRINLQKWVIKNGPVQDLVKHNYLKEDEETWKNRKMMMTSTH